MAYVFRRPWKEWRRDKPHPPFLLPPATPAVFHPDIIALGRRPVVSYSGSKNYTFRRPWWNWGGARYRGIRLNSGFILTTSSASYSVSAKTVTFTTTLAEAVAAYSVSGQTVTFTTAISGAVAAYTVTPQTAAFGISFSAEAASYLVTAYTVTFGLIRESWLPVTDQNESWTTVTKQSDTWTERTKQSETWTEIDEV